MFIILIAFTILNIGLAFIDAHKIIKSKAINHVLNAAVYIGLVAIPALLFKNYWFVGALLFNRLVFFNIALSLFRGKSWDYVSPMPTAITDRIARKIFDDHGVLMYAIYSILFIILTVISFV